MKVHKETALDTQQTLASRLHGELCSIAPVYPLERHSGVRLGQLMVCFDGISPSSEDCISPLTSSEMVSYQGRQSKGREGA